MPSQKYQITKNPCVEIKPGCKSLNIFEKSIALLSKKWDDGFFSWHGTSELGITGITCSGFDTARRSG